MYFRKLLPCCLAVGLAACSGGRPGEVGGALKKVPRNANSYTLFESLQVRPLALSPNGTMLFAANTPDNRLEIFRISHGTLVPMASVFVGLEPVAVAARNDNEVWVVNHLSDSISIVQLNGDGARVVRTLHVGDEPRDIVFGGVNKDRAFITTAHRGQNTGDPYDLQSPIAVDPVTKAVTPIGRADVWVFDANHLGSNAGGTRLAKITLFADTPRALAVTPDGKTVYAAAFFSGNQTTSVSKESVQATYAKLGKPVPASTVTVQTPIGPMTFPQPQTGLIVKFDGTHWLDAYGTIFDDAVHVNAPDLDVFAIDATSTPPAAIPPQLGGAFAHVGTTLFNMAVNPKTGKVYVTNTDARNHIRFEGHADGFTSVRGHITDSRITVLDPATHGMTQANLNSHINYDLAGDPAEKALSVAFPQDLTVSSDGSTVFTVAQGSGKLAIYSSADLEAGKVTPSLANQVTLSGGGPAGVALDEARGRAYVLTRFDNSISIVDVAARTEVKHVAMFNPEPASVTNGRKYLYDANLTSSHGDTACASCHIGGDFDGLAWDLGNPGVFPLPITPDTNNNVMTISPAAIIALLPATAPVFQYYMQLKGPMTTQSLRGMDNHGPMHWRGDRNGSINQDGTPVIDPGTGKPIVSMQPNAGIFDEVRAFTSFNVAFPGLVGGPAQLSDRDMLDFATFILQATYPPNPIRNLDNSLTPDQTAGQAFFFNHAPDGTPLPSDRFHNCNGCHTLDPKGNLGKSPHPGFFGTDGRLSFEFETQLFKVPHLRNMYQKLGMFGSSPDSLQPGTIVLQTDPKTGKPIIFPAVRSFGFQHDGSLGQLEHFFTGQVFLQTLKPVLLSSGNYAPPNPFGIPFIDPNALPNIVPSGPATDPFGITLRAQIVAYLYAFDSNLAPIVGQQVTLTADTSSTAAPRIALLESRAAAGECDLIVRGGSAGEDRGFLFAAGGFQSDRSRDDLISDAALRASVQSDNQAVYTFTCVPPGAGVRMALDRNGDGIADGDQSGNGSHSNDSGNQQ